MEKFCRFCGKELTGTPCDCLEAVAQIDTPATTVQEQPAPEPAVEAPISAPAAVSPLEQAATAEVQESVIDTPTAPPSYTPPAQDAPPAAQAPTPVVIPTSGGGSAKVNLDFQGIFNEAKAVVQGLLKDPVGTARSSKNMSLPVSLSILGVQAVAFMLMTWGCLLKISATLGPYANVSYGGVFYALLLMLLEPALLFGCLYAVGIPFKNPIQPAPLLGAVAVGSPLWSATFLASMLVFLVFGFTSSFGMYITLLLSTFALCWSLYLLENAVRAQVPSDYNHLLVITIAFSVHFVVFWKLMSVFMVDQMAGSMFRLF